MVKMGVIEEEKVGSYFGGSRKGILLWGSDYWSRSWWWIYQHVLFLLIKFYKATYYNILPSNHILQVLLPFQDASLIINVSVFEARMVFNW